MFALVVCSTGRDRNVARATLGEGLCVGVSAVCAWIGSTIAHVSASPPIIPDSRLVQGGVCLAKVSKLLGHSSITTTEIYAHLASNEVSEEATAVLNRLQANPAPFAPPRPGAHPPRSPAQAFDRLQIA